MMFRGGAVRKKPVQRTAEACADIVAESYEVGQTVFGVACAVAERRLWMVWALRVEKYGQRDGYN